MRGFIRYADVICLWCGDIIEVPALLSVVEIPIGKLTFLMDSIDGNVLSSSRALPLLPLTDFCFPSNETMRKVVCGLRSARVKTPRGGLSPRPHHDHCRTKRFQYFSQ